MAEIVAANPFVARRAHTKDLYVAFARDPIRGEPGVDRTYEPDEFCVAPHVVYMHTPAGYGRTKLNASVLQRVAGSSVTARNWNTVTKLADLAAGAADRRRPPPGAPSARDAAAAMRMRSPAYD